MEISGFKPCVFGPIYWSMISIISYGYPEYVPPTQEGLQLKNDTYTFFKSLGSMLPCSECKQHYKQNLDLLELENSLDSREQLTKFVYNLHNLVNLQTNVPQNKWPTYEEVSEKYNAMRSNDCDPNSCNTSESLYKCKVDFIPVKQNSEWFSSSSNGSYIVIGLIVGLGLLLLVGLLYLNKSKNLNKKTKDFL